MWCAVSRQVTAVIKGNKPDCAEMAINTQTKGEEYVSQVEGERNRLILVLRNIEYERA